MFCADPAVSSDKTNSYPVQHRIKHHLLQVGHAHDVELGREREGQWEPVAVAALAVGGQGVAQGAPADAQAAVGDQDNLRGPGTVRHCQLHRAPCGSLPAAPAPTQTPYPSGFPPPSWAKLPEGTPQSRRN